MPKILFKWKDIASAEKYYRGKNYAPDRMKDKIRLDMVYGTSVVVEDIEAFQKLFSVGIINGDLERIV